MTERLCRAQAGEPTSVEVWESSVCTLHSHGKINLINQLNSVETRSKRCPPEDTPPVPSRCWLVRSAFEVTA